MTHLMQDLEFASSKRDAFGKGNIVGIRIEDHDDQNPRFLGYEIIDSYWSCSLLTNWGSDIAFINSAVGSNGLIASYDKALGVHKQVLRDFPDDSHAESCKLISLYCETV